MPLKDGQDIPGRDSPLRSYHARTKLAGRRQIGENSTPSHSLQSRKRHGNLEWSLQARRAFEQLLYQGQKVLREARRDHYGVAGTVSVGKDRTVCVVGNQEEGRHCERDEVCEDRRRQSYKSPW
jgi:hypothetical protein